MKAAAMGLGMKGLMADLGVEVGVQVNTDSSAARASHRGVEPDEFNTLRYESCGCRTA